jgi:hypothetical protein
VTKPLKIWAPALRAVSDWVFEPATLEGRPVRVHYSLTVSFKVKFGPPPH